MWHFLTGLKPPSQKKAKLSETDARYEKEKRKRERHFVLQKVKAKLTCNQEH